MLQKYEGFLSRNPSCPHLFTHWLSHGQKQGTKRQKDEETKGQRDKGTKEKGAKTNYYVCNEKPLTMA